MVNAYEVVGDGGTTAIIYGDDYPDPGELQQIYAMLACPAFAGATVRIMPDHHAGAGCVIGFTAPMDRNDPKVVPNVVGVDIGCGVHAVRLPTSAQLREEEFAAFDRHLRAKVPAGFAVRDEEFRDLELVYAHMDRDTDVDAFRARVDALAKKIGTKLDRVWASVGTLGGGNHFIELDRADDGVLWLTVHSGSRNFGLQVANHYQRLAHKEHPRGALSWLDGDAAREYLADMRTAQRFARLNRAVMLFVLAEAAVGRVHERLALPSVLSVHNYIGDDDVIRKGAVSAREGEAVIIPWNMRDGVVLGLGRGNTAWNESAPHGAGRRMGRKEAKNTLSVTEYKAAMAGIWSSCVGKATIDEAPDAYKPAAAIEGALAETVEVTARLRPIYNFKASEEGGR